MRTAADVIIIGSGVAGLSLALHLQHYRVLVLTKTQFGAGSSLWAQGGVAAAVGEGDSPALHAQDTLAVSGGLANPDAVAVLTQEGPESVHELIRLGVQFDHDDGHLALGREAAHSLPRILHAHGDATGAELVRALGAAVQAAHWIEVVESTRVEDLVVQADRVVGVVARQHTGQDQAGQNQVITARAVILATGGIGQLYRYTTNPPEATADGLALAARAGASLADVEFVQFHPTALAVGSDPLPLLTEALRGAGAILVDDAGNRFMLQEHDAAELAPRDIVARSVWRRLQAGQRVFLDARSAIGAEFPQRFPTVFAHCQEHGLDPRHDPMPIVPAAHYHMGGVAVDLQGRTSRPGLWACGEVASTGVHGANRLASNSLLEALVFARRVSQDVQRCLGSHRIPSRMPALGASEIVRVDPGGEAADLIQRIRTIMWEQVGLVRTEAGLLEALQEFRDMAAAVAEPKAADVRNMLTAAQLIATAALSRRESRGAHFRADYPQADT
ncbi:MAG: L-aspartate oxidase [Candidatus Tectomicrobia bacterium]|nr:L-aspartate oxidase [Candidatus Tectomicrobia bacterium]